MCDNDGADAWYQHELEGRRYHEERHLATVTYLKARSLPRVDAEDLKKRRTFHERMLSLLDQDFMKMEESRRYHTAELQDINVRLFDLSRRARA